RSPAASAGASARRRRSARRSRAAGRAGAGRPTPRQRPAAGDRGRRGACRWGGRPASSRCGTGSLTRAFGFALLRLRIAFLLTVMLACLLGAGGDVGVLPLLLSAGGLWAAGGTIY